ncbi:MAG: hypothetical protein GFH25_541276n27 [Chloroflexi bacterium AL-N10]|nr:hypothetical protein [Chloroflexi bacterium AL-N1]NOK71108.1 hypothetical protein [Chloroflexi bacterium AL-N10]NOK77356.1 hypothetical protein [Chloroflexi bacterium AL-N5]
MCYFEMKASVRVVDESVILGGFWIIIFFVRSNAICLLQTDTKLFTSDQFVYGSAPVMTYMYYRFELVHWLFGCSIHQYDEDLHATTQHDLSKLFYL